VRISRGLYEKIVEHARAEAPNECVGVIESRDGVAVAVHRATNAAHSPLRYEVDSRELFRIHDRIEQAGNELGAIYHSHTRSEPYPSQTDVNLAHYPDSLYVIVGLARQDPDVRAWRIVGGRISEGELEVEEG
jgi:[CysO sulfur-carrier protein]-S-L-cysteine hydrolase